MAPNYLVLLTHVVFNVARLSCLASSTLNIPYKAMAQKFTSSIPFIEPLNLFNPMPRPLVSKILDFKASV